MKKIYFYLILSFLVLLILIFTFLYFSSRSKKNILQPPLTPVPSITGPAGLDDSVFPTLTQEQIVQVESDREYGEWFKELNDSYPWRAELPLRTTDYFVYFDIYQKKFIALIYNAGQENAIKTEVQNSLKNIDSDTGNYEIIWQIK